ncbi:MAG: hypothetical protein JWQ15_2045, partial [Marmoricola sp.]|nr:hypothetical protein [Marmoricola sp.]
MISTATTVLTEAAHGGHVPVVDPGSAG